MNLLLLAFIILHALLADASLPKIKGIKEAAQPTKVNLSDRPSYRNNVVAKSAAALADCKQKKECQTTGSINTMASPLYRRVGYQMGKALGFKDAHIMFILNDPTESTAEIGPEEIDGKKCKAISLNIPRLKDNKIGVTYLILGHEWTHEAIRVAAKKPTHYYPKNHSSKNQTEENECDKRAALARNCRHCTMEFASYYLNKHNAQKAKIKGISEKEIAESNVDKLTDRRLSLLIELASITSRNEATTHPLDLERYLRLHKISRTQYKSCPLHKKKATQKEKQSK
jgi:hypothetical protein